MPYNAEQLGGRSTTPIKAEALPSFGFAEMPQIGAVVDDPPVGEGMSEAPRSDMDGATASAAAVTATATATDASAFVPSSLEIQQQHPGLSFLKSFLK